MVSGLMKTTASLNNAEIADLLTSLAQLLSAQKENPYKVKAYRRAAETIRVLSESVDQLVRSGADLTEYAGIGKGIAGAIQEIVLSGTLGKLETLRSQASPELAAISEYPRLDPQRVLRIYKKLNISSIAELKEKLESGGIREKLGVRMEQHVRRALVESHEMLLYDAEDLAAAVEEFLRKKCGASRIEPTGDYRRRVEVVGEISFLIETGDFPVVISKVQQYGGNAEVVSSGETSALFKLSSGILLRIETANSKKWGVAMIVSTGSKEHLCKLATAGAKLEMLGASKDSYPSEAMVYRKLGMSFIEPELREGHDEVDLAAARKLPALVKSADIRGELHAHSTSSDGANTIEQMAAAARKKGYEYIGITDHSQSLKIAGGVAPADLWKQIGFIDKLNGRLRGIRVLKSAEVDILPDGSLDYADELLRELDYTVCSIHSKFSLGKAEQTERILRAMDNRYFTILGHATGRLLLKRPGFEIDMERIVDHARKNGCFFEINSSPDRLDLSAANARLARDAGIKIAISTDAHSTRELEFIRCGIEQARRAGLEKASVLNCLSWSELERTLKR